MKYLVFSLLTWNALALNAQQVQSKSYKLMLNTLLSHSVPELSVSEVNQIQGATLLDARERKEYDVSHIEDAHWVGYDDFSLDRVKDVPKDQEIIVYCSVGYRSEKVSEHLINAGYTNVHNLYGGIFEWKNQGKVVVDTTQLETEKVHAYNKVWGVWLKEGEKVYR